MTNLSRRALITSAAALPAFAVPAAALPALMSPIPTDAPPPELLALGEQLKPLLAELQRLKPQFRKLYEQARDAAGYEDLSMATKKERDACHARFDATAEQIGYLKLSRQMDRLHSKACRLARRILKIEVTDRTGDSIHAAAVLVLDHDEIDSMSGEFLWRMAARAGFSRS